MPLRDDLKDYIPKSILVPTDLPTGHVVGPEEYNSRWELNVDQGNDTGTKLKEVLTMMYETIFSDTDGAPHVFIDDAEFAATTVKDALLELALRTANTIITIQSNDVDIQAGVDALITHKTADDHDGRYFTEAEITAFESAMQLLVNQNAAGVISLQSQISALDDIYSTDSERAVAIAATIAAFELADDDIELILNGKADQSNVYTKAEIDAMTLGSYKMDIDKRYVNLAVPTQEVTILTEGWNADTDTILVEQGGIGIDEGVEWEMNVAQDAIKAIGDPFPAGSRISYFVIRNLRVVTIEDQMDGALILDSTIARVKLNTGLLNELDGLRTDVDTKAVVLFGTGTIPITGWVVDTTDYAYRTTRPVTGLLDTDWIDIVIDRDYHDVAGDAELCPTVIEANGYFRVYANNIPTEEIPFKWKVVR